MIEAYARKYIGIPFVSGGRGVDGCDCYGLVRLVYQNEFKISLPEIDGYANALIPELTNPLFQRYSPLILGERHEIPRPNDLVLINNRGLPTHLGVYVGESYILHTVRRIGSCLQRVTDRDLTNRIEGYYGIKTPHGAQPVQGRVHRQHDRLSEEL